MRVLIETEVFAQAGETAWLASLFGLGLARKHRIQVEDDRAAEQICVALEGRGLLPRSRLEEQEGI